jgi:hypothetical protein
LLPHTGRSPLYRPYVLEFRDASPSKVTKVSRTGKINFRFACPKNIIFDVRQGVIQATSKASDGKASANKVGGKGTLNHRGVCSSQTKNALVGYQVQSISTMDYY